MANKRKGNSLSIKKGSVSANVDFAYYKGIETLANATDSINQSLLKGAASFCEIAYTLKEVEVHDLTANTEYKNVTDYAEKVFGFKHAQTSNYIKLAKRFLIANSNESKLAFNNAVGNNHFSVSQLTETLTLPEKVANELIEAGAINDQQTIKQIREIVKKKKAELRGETAEETEDIENANEEIVYDNSNIANDECERDFAAENAAVIEKGFAYMYAGLEQYINEIAKMELDNSDEISENLKSVLCRINDEYNYIVNTLREMNVAKILAFDMETINEGF